MPETPDFDQIASRIFSDHGQLSIAKALRDVWNARGAADIVKLEAELTVMMGGTMSGPYVKNLERALRRLDR
jgi:hypothetical protein